MTFSDMGCGKVIEGAIESVHNEEWIGASLMGKMLSALKVRLRFHKKMFELFFPQVLSYVQGEFKWSGPQQLFC